jgi:hypothetical protein
LRYQVQTLRIYTKSIKVRIYLKRINENVDLAKRITFSISDFRLKASNYSNLGFAINPRRENGEKTFERREMGTDMS